MADNKTLLERFVSDLNGNVFLREFAFSSSEILLPGVGTIQIADHLVFLDEYALVVQLKQRDSNASATRDDLNAWFDRKVRRVAVTQLRDTLAYLQEHDSLQW
jgi:hypothetical protein